MQWMSEVYFQGLLSIPSSVLSLFEELGETAAWSSSSTVVDCGGIRGSSPWVVSSVCGFGVVPGVTVALTAWLWMVNKNQSDSYSINLYSFPDQYAEDVGVPMWSNHQKSNFRIRLNQYQHFFGDPEGWVSAIDRSSPKWGFRARTLLSQCYFNISCNN